MDECIEIKGYYYQSGEQAQNPHDHTDEQRKGEKVIPCE